jgi:acyl carrier protein phosphodiesterase
MGFWAEALVLELTSTRMVTNATTEYFPRVILASLNPKSKMDVKTGGSPEVTIANSGLKTGQTRRSFVLLPIFTKPVMGYRVTGTAPAG